MWIRFEFYSFINQMFLTEFQLNWNSVVKLIAWEVKEVLQILIKLQVDYQSEFYNSLAILLCFCRHGRTKLCNLFVSLAGWVTLWSVLIGYFRDIKSVSSSSCKIVKCSYLFFYIRRNNNESGIDHKLLNNS